MAERGRERRGRAGRMWCQSCWEEYEEPDAGTCKECYEEASETEEELKREIEDLKAKVSFLRLDFPPESSAAAVLLLADAASSSPAIPAHRAVLFGSSIRYDIENAKSSSL